MTWSRGSLGRFYQECSRERQRAFGSSTRWRSQLPSKAVEEASVVRVFSNSATLRLGANTELSMDEFLQHPLPRDDIILENPEGKSRTEARHHAPSFRRCPGAGPTQAPAHHEFHPEREFAQPRPD
jgi:hypothetical protein